MILRLLEELSALRKHVATPVFIDYLAALALSSPQILKKRSLNPADARMTGKAYNVSLDGVQYRMDGVHFGLARELYCREIYFPSAEWRPGKGDFVIDLGANCGSFSLLCAKRGATVVGIDAQKHLAPLYEKLMAQNGVSERATFINGLVAPDNGVLESHGLDVDFKTMAVHGEDLVRLAQGRRIRFIKADVEGCEFALFGQDLRWLDHVDRIAMEVHPSYGDATAMRDRLRAAGFNCWLTDKSGAVVDRIGTYVGFCYAARPDAAAAGLH